MSTGCPLCDGKSVAVWIGRSVYYMCDYCGCYTQPVEVDDLHPTKMMAEFSARRLFEEGEVSR